MTDRELLLAAAKAAGLEVVGPVEKYIAQFYERQKGGFIIRNDRGGDSIWNSLADDGDALRLAVKLGIEVRDVHQYGKACAYLRGPMLEFWENNGDDPCAATRRAITRAAAELWIRENPTSQPPESAR